MRLYTYDTKMNKQRSIRMQFLILIVSSSDREFSVSAEILVQNATENRNTALIFCFDLGTFSWEKLFKKCLNKKKS
jgi:hypothetical protein